MILWIKILFFYICFYKSYSKNFRILEIFFNFEENRVNNEAMRC